MSNMVDQTPDLTGLDLAWFVPLKKRFTPPPLFCGEVVDFMGEVEALTYRIGEKPFTTEDTEGTENGHRGFWGSWSL
jgi:hypothetical protein